MMAVIVVSIWGMTFVSTKFLLNSGLAPTEIFLARFIIAYLGILLVSHGKLFCDNVKDELLSSVTGIFGGSLYFIVENVALEKSTASNVALIVCTAPIFTLFISAIMNKSRLSPSILAGLVISMAGVAVLLFKDSGEIHFNPAGDMLALTAAILWSLYTIALVGLMKKYDSPFITRKTFFYGIVTALPAFLLTDGNFTLSMISDAGILLNLIFLGIVASLICYFAWAEVISRLGAVKASNYLYLNPVAAVISSSILIGENITAMLVVGMLLVFAGIFISQRNILPEEK